MAIAVLMELLKEYWAIMLFVSGILWHLIQQYFDFQRLKERQASSEKTTSEYIGVLEKRNQEKYDKLELEVKNHRKELEREIEIAKQKAEKEILKTKDELGTRIDKMLEVMSAMNLTITKMEAGFGYIKESLEELKNKK